MAEYIACRRCDSPDCKGCNLKRLETMLENGKFECLMNENRAINTSADVTPVVHGRWCVDAVSVVRCMECKHCDPENYHCDHPMGTAAPLKRKPDDFCSYGERKDGDSDG